MLRLPATPAELLREVIEPALTLLPVTMDSARSRAMLVATARQESNIEHRRQIAPGGGFGPARSPWQFEQGGGVAGVLGHHSTDDLARMVCRKHNLAQEARTVHRAMEFNDALGCQFARLLLWTHPTALPALTLEAEQFAFEYYEWLWRPGAHKTSAGKARARARWAKAWPEAIKAVR